MVEAWPELGLERLEAWGAAAAATLCTQRDDQPCLIYLTSHLFRCGRGCDAPDGGGFLLRRTDCGVSSPLHPARQPAPASQLSSACGTVEHGTGVAHQRDDAALAHSAVRVISLVAHQRQRDGQPCPLHCAWPSLWSRTSHLFGRAPETKRRSTLPTPPRVAISLVAHISSLWSRTSHLLGRGAGRPGCGSCASSCSTWTTSHPAHFPTHGRTQRDETTLSDLPACYLFGCALGTGC